MPDRDTDNQKTRRGINWPTALAAIGLVVALAVVIWLVKDKLPGSTPPEEPPPTDVLEQAPGPDNRATELPDELPEPEGDEP